MAETVGIIEYQITKSDINQEKILYIKNIYIDNNFRKSYLCHHSYIYNSSLSN